MLRGRQKKDSNYLSTSQLEVSKIYRDKGAVCEFLTQQCSTPDRPFKLPEHERAILRVLWLYNYVYICAARRAGKTHCIGNFFAALGGILSGIPQTLRFGAVSGSMRQVSYIYEELSKTVDNSPFLQSLTSYGPKLTKDAYIWELKGWRSDSGAIYEGHTFIGLPLGASKGSQNLRGTGTSGLFMDEFTLVPESSYQALLPVGATSRDPMADIERIQRAKSDIWSPPVFDPTHERLIFCSTWDYEFVPAYKVFSQYRNNTALNMVANELLKAFDYHYPYKRDKDKFHELARKVFLYLGTDTQTHYYPVLEADMESGIVKEFIDYLRSYWYGYRYMCLEIPRNVLPEDWHRKEWLDTILPLLSDIQICHEFDGPWTSDSSGVFRGSTLFKATDESIGVEVEGEDQHVYIIGVDPGENKKFGISILKVIQHPDKSYSCQIIYVREYDITEKSLNHPSQVRLLFGLLNQFKTAIGLVVDRGGGGVAISSSMMEQKEPYGDTWGEFGKPVLNIEEENDGREGKEMLWLVAMDNKTVFETNSRLLAGLQSGHVRIAGAPPGEGEEDVYEDIQKLKKQMARLVIKPVGGTMVKIDLPSKPTDASHSHDLWSALTLAYLGYLQYIEGNLFQGDEVTTLPTGFWDTGW